MEIVPLAQRRYPLAMDSVVHPFPPIYDEKSKILILGSFPSVKSREEGFYYGHPRNRFWPMLERIFSAKAGTIEEKKELLLFNHIALWDSIASCHIEGSADSSILDAVPNDILTLLNKTQIERIITNGRKSYEVYMEYIFPKTSIEPIYLPSTSPANASWTLDKLIDAWKQYLTSN